MQNTADGTFLTQKEIRIRMVWNHPTWLTQLFHGQTKLFGRNYSFLQD
jgi:hypothetical protein